MPILPTRLLLQGMLARSGDMLNSSAYMLNAMGPDAGPPDGPAGWPRVVCLAAHRATAKERRPAHMTLLQQTRGEMCTPHD